MSHAVDSDRLKAAADHLEWVLLQYPHNELLQNMLHGLERLIRNASAGAIRDAVDMQDVPFNWAVNSEGLYDAFDNPSVRNAFVAFQIELEGGLNEQDKEINARIVALRASLAGTKARE